jgi:hypothetical protein
VRNEAASNRLEACLGQKLSVLFRVHGDPDHPFSEAVGLLQRVEVDSGGSRTLVVLRRDGTLVAVPERDLVKLKLVPASRGPVRAPRSWSRDQES